MDTLKTGGKLYDEGGYGCIFIPPLTCKEEKAKAKKTVVVGKSIDKLLVKAEAEGEYAIALKIQNIPLWKNYFLVAQSICTPAAWSKQTETDLDRCHVLTDKQASSYRLLRLQFGGIPLSQYRFNFYEHSFLDFTKHFLEAGALMCLFGVVHRDLHQGNILVDSAHVPRIIDFNLSIDTRKPVVQKSLLHGVAVDLFHEPPDSCLVNAIASGRDGFATIDAIMTGRKSLLKLKSVLGISTGTMREQLETFYRTSKAASEGDIVSWFNTYWRTIDSWAVGINIVLLILNQLLWPSFSRGEFSDYSEKLFAILRDMCNLNPMQRIDCVQALARLDTNNYIISKYGQDWLRRVSDGASHHPRV